MRTTSTTKTGKSGFRLVSCVMECVFELIGFCNFHTCSNNVSEGVALAKTVLRSTDIDIINILEFSKLHFDLVILAHHPTSGGSH